MTSGKSTMAKGLAAHYNLQLIDLDVEIEQVEGQSISEIITNNGELYFRKVERKVLEEVLNRDQFVLATGGGTPCYFNSIELLNEKSVCVYLDVPLKELVNRINADKSKRPLVSHLKDEEMQEFVAKHLFERRQVYQQAHKIVSGTTTTLTDILTVLQ